jgi:hypothetical protein
MQMMAPNQSASSVTRDLTGADLSTHLAPVSAKGSVHVGFFWAQVRLKTKNPDKHGLIETRLCLAKQPVGDRLTRSHAFISKEDAARHYPEQYAHFTNFETGPMNGTPLMELPGVSRSEINLMEMHAIYCVEDLLALGNDRAQQLGMDAARIYRVADKWMQTKEGSSDIVLAAENEAKMHATLDSLQKQLEAAQARAMQAEAEAKALRTLTPAQAQQTVTVPVHPAADAVGFESVDTIDENDGFLAGGDMATGNDDLAGGDPDPLA